MINIEIDDMSYAPKILVMGIGGGGNNALDRMISSQLKGVCYAAVNTDAQVLNHCHAEILLQIGEKLTGGYGAGADPSVGEAAAIESEDDIKSVISGYNMVILTCGMGGGTGTGAIPVIAKCCRDAGVLVMAVVTMPFTFESGQRTTVAQAGVEKLKNYVDTLLVIPNDKLLTISERTLYLEDAFVMADSILKYTIEGITNIVYNQGTINIDFNDLKSTIANKGMGHLGIGTVASDGSILEAVKQAINSPLLETSIEGAENMLINTSGRINIIDLNEAISYVRDVVGSNVKIIWGTVTDKEQEDDKIVVTLIATGMPNPSVASAMGLNLTNKDLFDRSVGYRPKTEPAKMTDTPKYNMDENLPTIKYPYLKPVQPPASSVKEKAIVLPPFLTNKGVR